MAACRGSSSKWFFTREQIEATPSRRSGVDPDRELSYRQQAANLIQDMGQRLNVYPLYTSLQSSDVEGRRIYIALFVGPCLGHALEAGYVRRYFVIVEHLKCASVVSVIIHPSLTSKHHPTFNIKGISLALVSKLAMLAAN